MDRDAVLDRQQRTQPGHRVRRRPQASCAGRPPRGAAARPPLRVERAARSWQAATSSRSPIASIRGGVAGQRLVDELPVLQGEAGGLAGDQGGPPLGDPALPQRLAGAGELGPQRHGQGNVALTARVRLPPGQRDLRRDPAVAPRGRHAAARGGLALRASKSAVTSACAPSAAHLSSSSARIRSIRSASSSPRPDPASLRVQFRISSSDGSAAAALRRLRPLRRSRDPS